jgi:uncharacterized surface protein with fasciclin (FAS1) repeats
MYKRQFLSLLAASALFCGTASVSRADHHSKDIVDIAASDPSFSTLVAAIKAAGLVVAL